MSPEQALHTDLGEVGEKLTKNTDKERTSNKAGLWRVGRGLEVDILISSRQLHATAVCGKAMEIRASPHAVLMLDGVRRALGGISQEEEESPGGADTVRRQLLPHL